MRRRSPLSRQSTKARTTQAGQRAAYQVVDAGPRFCIACGGNDQLTRSHCLTQKQFPRHAANPANLVFLCLSDHQIWENNKARFRQMYPDAWAQKMEIMQRLEPNYYAFFRMKNENLFH